MRANTGCCPFQDSSISGPGWSSVLHHVPFQVSRVECKVWLEAAGTWQLQASAPPPALASAESPGPLQPALSSPAMYEEGIMLSFYNQGCCEYPPSF